MSEHLRNQILDALYSAMRPIARFLLRAGISYREFNDIVKAAFVDVATEDYGIRGRPTNISRVAVMTGLTRKEVKRLRGLGGVEGQARLSKRSPPAEVLHYWFTDPDYLSASGEPLSLPYEGADVSFSSLVKKCAGDIPPGALRTELKRVNSIEEDPDGTLTAKRRDHFPPDSGGRLLTAIRYGLTPLASTIAYNSERDPGESTRFQRTVHSALVSAASLAKYEQATCEKLVRLTEELDDELSSYELSPDRPSGREKANVGVGLFFFIDEEH